MKIIEMYHNNSGGKLWLTKKQCDALVEAGWVARWVDWCDEVPRYFYYPDSSMRMAKASFQDATEEDPDEMGCACCGEPYRFSYIDKKDLYEILNKKQITEFINEVK